MLVLTIRGIVFVTPEGGLAVQTNLRGEKSRVGFAATGDIRIIRFDVLEAILRSGLDEIKRSPKELSGLHEALRAASEKSLAGLRDSYQRALNAVRADQPNAGVLFAALADPNVLEMLVEFNT